MYWMYKFRIVFGIFFGRFENLSTLSDLKPPLVEEMASGLKATFFTIYPKPQ